MNLYIYISAVCLLGRSETKEERVRRGRVGDEGGGKWIVAIRMISSLFLILPNFMIVNGLFDVNMKCLFCGEFCWVMMIIEIKIITLLFFLLKKKQIIYNDCVVKGYVV